MESLTEGTHRRLVPAKRSARWPGRSATGTRGPGYRSALPCRALYVSTANLCSIRCGTRSQWRLTSASLCGPRISCGRSDGQLHEFQAWWICRHFNSNALLSYRSLINWNWHFLKFPGEPHIVFRFDLAFQKLRFRYVRLWTMQLRCKVLVDACRHVTPVCSEVDHEWTSFVCNVICSADSIPAIHSWTARFLARLPQINWGLNYVHRYAPWHLLV